MAYIEHDFPIERLNRIAAKEAPVGGRKPIYNIHKWWARRLGSVFRMLTLATFSAEDLTAGRLWQRYYSRNDLGGKVVLDPFMGGGTTVVEALRLGCRVIGIDLNPVAWFVTKKELEPVDLDALDQAFRQLQQTVAPEITKYYKTTCPKCDEEVDVMYVFWVKKLPCSNCGEDVRLFGSFHIASNKGNHTVFCPTCYHVQRVDEIHTQAVCQACGTAFIPSNGYAGQGTYTCAACGQKDRVVDAIHRQQGTPATEMFALEYYCPRDGRDYKAAGAEDRELFLGAVSELERRRAELLFPRQRIPRGLKTRELLNHKYEYFYQMFNERQLLCLAILLEQILRITDDNVRELLLLAFSGTVDYSNMLCKYNARYRNMQNLFSHHAYWPPSTPTENNVWGAALGKGTFVASVAKVRAAKEYAGNPFEKTFDDSARTVKVYTQDPVEAHLAASSEEFLRGGRNTLLLATTAEDLGFLEAQSVDAVITDPPYCDNVMYAELADFFHVWLRLGLKDAYECFQQDYSPKAREIVKNPAQGKDDGFFFKGLSRVFAECRRVLKDDGLMVFTFHHREPWAWASVLQGLVDSGFRVVAIYPVHSEAGTSTHLLGTSGIQYDIPFVCRKRLTPGAGVSWTSLQDQVHVEARHLLNKLRHVERETGDVDLFVVTMGKGLELYTKHYPNVLKDGVAVPVAEAVSDIGRIVETLVKDFEIRQLPAHLDEPTRMYALYLAGRKELSFDELNKRVQVGGGDSDVVFERKFVEREGSALRVLPPAERRGYIDGLMGREKPLSQMDQIHYLYDQFVEKRSIRPYLKQWASTDLQAVCELLYRKTGDRQYESLRQQIEQYLRSPAGQLELGL